MYLLRKVDGGRPSVHHVGVGQHFPVLVAELRLVLYRIDDHCLEQPEVGLVDGLLHARPPVDVQDLLLHQLERPGLGGGEALLRHLEGGVPRRVVDHARLGRLPQEQLRLGRAWDDRPAGAPEGRKLLGGGGEVGLVGGDQAGLVPLPERPHEGLERARPPAQRLVRLEMELEERLLDHRLADPDAREPLGERRRHARLQLLRELGGLLPVALDDVEQPEVDLVLDHLHVLHRVLAARAPSSGPPGRWTRRRRRRGRWRRPA